MKIDFIETNEQKKISNIEKKKEEFNQKMQETYTHFPYTGSEQVEKNDKSLK
jgi:hypothetical protein